MERQWLLQYHQIEVFAEQLIQDWLEISNQELKNTNNHNINNIVNEPNIVNKPKVVKKSILTILNTNFKDTPSINYIKEKEFHKSLELVYNEKINNKLDKLFNKIILDYKKKRLVDRIGDIIIKFIKKNNKKEQSSFNIDSSRGNYATKLKDVWCNDKGGFILKKYTIDVIIHYIIDLFNKYKQNLKKKYKNVDIDRNYIILQEILLNIEEFLTDSNVHKKIIIYMCPELRTDDIVLNAITNDDKI